MAAKEIWGKERTRRKVREEPVLQLVMALTKIVKARRLQDTGRHVMPYRKDDPKVARNPKNSGDVIRDTSRN